MLLAAAAFAATNVDNLLLLVTFSALLPFTRVGAAFLLSAGAILLLALVGVLIGVAANPHWLGYLGSLPLGLGIYRGWRAYSGKWNPGHTAHNDTVSGYGIFLILLSNSGDTLAILLPLVADTELRHVPGIVVATLITAALWLALARSLMRHGGVARAIAAQERWLLPVVMIAVGVFVLLDTAGDRLLPAFSGPS